MLYILFLPFTPLRQDQSFLTEHYEASVSLGPGIRQGPQRAGLFVD